ncbi:HNH endonuclease family protein [Nocardioides bizhenqiangii]|uniref:HNH endonuclease family protein n=1 Tax=Nocardioides bizhenqiangii TaxID=3095076 RepID=A0ABZ0ZQU2_9ACTN|nr:HNH endonuclease family protein [Nocardioides sp. HM61]WQQ26613.1 HNH endonuclease family protein [Nocardioides sp. HM61]
MKKLALATITGVVATLVIGVGPAPAAHSAPDHRKPGPAQRVGETYSAPLVTAVNNLPVATEVRTGYLRSKFTHWVDADGDGCNTRYEVLDIESETSVTCSNLSGGRWFSYYDRVSWTDPGRIDIDHVVPLAEAWDSGARNWTSAQRQSFANDLGDSRSLVGVTDSVNGAKGDQDPAQWLPTYDKCRYLREFVAVKIRWRLTVNSGEKTAMQNLAAGCSNVSITVVRAI